MQVGAFNVRHIQAKVKVCILFFLGFHPFLIIIFPPKWKANFQFCLVYMCVLVLFIIFVITDDY